MKSLSQYAKLKRWYAEQLRAKDKIIAELRKEREVLLKTALQQSQHMQEWQKIAKEFEKRSS
jgi:hypothetical protein